jgi:hypothetical protein
MTLRSTGEVGPHTYRSGNSGNDFRFFSTNGTFSSPTAKTNGSAVGQIHWHGYDGGAYRQMASIEVKVDGAPSTGYVPMRMELKTGGSSKQTAISMSKDGYVNKPSQPYFYAGGASSGAQTNGAVITGWSEFTDNDNNHSNGRFTAPIDGFYHISFGVRSQNASSYIYAQVRKNGAGAAGISAIEVQPGMATEHHTGGGYLYLSKNDYIEIYAGNNTHIDNSDHFAVVLVA